MSEYFDILDKYNYWQNKPEKLGLIREIYLKRIKSFIGNNLIKVIMGQRRAGKSYLLRQIINLLIDTHVNPKNIFYLNKEQIEFSKIRTSEDLVELIAFYENKMEITGKIYLIIDEVQEIDNWEKAVISYAYNQKKEYEVFISGSNSNMLSSELGTYLSGRYISFEVFPFSFLEYIKYFNLKKNKDSLIQYLKDSGLPELYTLKSTESRYHYVTALKDSILLNDIVKKFNIKDISLLESIFYLLIDSVGSLFSVNTLVKYLKSNGISTNFETVSNYISYLCKSLLIHKCEKYDIRGKRKITGNCKYYLNDIAYKHYFSSGFDLGLTRRLENIFYLHFKLSGYKVYVGSIYDSEVDFIIEKKDIKEYYQICYLLSNEEIVEREYRSLQQIKDNYIKAVISLDDVSFGNRNGIEHVLAWEIL